RPSYLRGHFSSRGWWYFYLYALAIKVPLGTWLLIGFASSISFWKSAISSQLSSQSAIAAPDEAMVLAPAIIILTFVSLQTGFSEHMRYVLPVLPFVFVWISRIVPLLRLQHALFRWLATAALIWSIASSLLVFPHSLSYFNELAGGPRG